MDKLNQEITILIVTFLSKKIIENCLSKIDHNYSIVIVENSNDKDFKYFLEKNFKNVKCLLTGKNLGYGAANNIGINFIRSKYALILNPDVELEKNVLSDLNKKIKEKNDFAILLPRLKNPKMDEFFKNKKNEDFAVDHNCIGENVASGCTMLLNLQQIKDLGLFDEKIFLYKEETDLIKRCNDNNLKVFSIPLCQVNHIGTSSFSSNTETEFEIELSRNWHWMWSNYYFYKKNFGILYAYKKTLRKLISSFFKMYLYFLMGNRKKHLIYKCRFSGLCNSYLNKPSWYRPKIKINVQENLSN